MKKARILKKLVILVLVLAVPGFLYYLLISLGKNHYNALPVFGPKKLAATTHRVHGKDIPDTIFHTLPNFKLTDQNGQPVSLSTFSGKIFVAGFFYTNCPGVCGQMNANVSRLVAAFAKNKLVEFVSITVDPARDSVPVLKKYAASFDAHAPKWSFLTGDTTTIYNLARKGFLVNAVQNSKTDFDYSDNLILIDEERRIRGYYKGAVIEDVSRLNDEIKVLISQEILDHDTPEY